MLCSRVVLNTFSFLLTLFIFPILPRYVRLNILQRTLVWAISYSRFVWNNVTPTKRSHSNITLCLKVITKRRFNYFSSTSKDMLVWRSDTKIYVNICFSFISVNEHPARVTCTICTSALRIRCVKDEEYPITRQGTCI